MGWILPLIALGITVFLGVQGERRAGLWSTSKLWFALAFAALELCLVLPPALFLDLQGPYFLPVFGVAWVAAAANFVWFIRGCRQWTLPDGRTSLEAARGEPARKQDQPAE